MQRLIKKRFLLSFEAFIFFRLWGFAKGNFTLLITLHQDLQYLIFIKEMGET